MTPLRFRARKATGEMWIGDLDQILRHDASVPTWLYENPEIPKDRATGLHDKNGKEIFEGDIVLWPDTESEFVDVGIGEVKVHETEVASFGPVVFRDAAFGVESPGGEAAKKGWYSLKDFLYDYCPPEDIEVIGNIYENPDLLPPTA